MRRTRAVLVAAFRLCAAFPAAAAWGSVAAVSPPAGAPPVEAEAATVAATDPGCGAPAELLKPGLPLGGAASGVATGRLQVLAVGSASVLGPGTSGPEAAWPVRLEALLRQRLPDATVTVEARGGRGLTAADQWALIQEALRRRPRPDLVIWQAGTTEAVRGLPVESMTETLLAGLDRLRTIGVDTVVMDLQFSRFLRANTDVAPYRQALEMAAAAGSAPLFDRYELMRAWVDAERIDVERAPPGQRRAAVDALNDCVARALAEFLIDGIREARH